MTHGDVVIVGAGPAGLAAAAELRRLGAGRVMVLEREVEAGGIPRHSHHTGFGWLDLHRIMSGPRYAAVLTRRAEKAGAEIRTGAMVTGWSGEHGLVLAGGTTLTARSIVLATGCRERPRAARLVAGDRPAGVLTTGLLQQAAAHPDPAVRAAHIGRRAVVVGAEHVSYSAVETLAHAGCRTVAMITDEPRHASFAGFHLGSAVRRRVRLHTESRVVEIVGHGRLEAVVVEHLGSGRRQRIECDTVVFTADWVPDHELARTGGLIASVGWPGPATDQRGRTSRPGVFAAGNLLHGAETADRCALEGRATAAAISDWLADGDWPVPPIAVEPGAGVARVWPTRLTTDSPVTMLTLRPTHARDHASVVVRQGDRVLHRSKRHRHLAAGRNVHLPGTAVADRDPHGPGITISCNPPELGGGPGPIDTAPPPSSSSSPRLRR